MHDAAVRVAERLGITVEQLREQLRVVEAKILADIDMCNWCETELPQKRRRDKRTCSAACRTAANTDRRKRSERPAEA